MRETLPLVLLTASMNLRGKVSGLCEEKDLPLAVKTTPVKANRRPIGRNSSIRDEIFWMSSFRGLKKCTKPALGKAKSSEARICPVDATSTNCFPNDVATELPGPKELVGVKT